MNTLTRKHDREGFTLNDRGGRVLIRSRRGNGAGTVLVFKGNSKPKRVHV